MNFRLNKISELFGYALTLVSLGYIASILVKTDLSTLRFDHPLLSLLQVLLFGALASCSVLIGAYSWKLILEFVNGNSVSGGDVFRVYLNSNIAKYLPGNVMHYAGRNYLGSKLGWKNTDMAFSSLLEYVFGFGLTGVVILLLAAFRLVELPDRMTLEVNSQAISQYGAIGLLLGIVMITLVVLYRYVVAKEHPQVTAGKMYSRASLFFTRKFLILLGKMFLITLGSFLFNCVFFFYLCDLIVGLQIRPEDIFNVNAALSIAGYASILTPGVPGGIGVKESVSLLLITAYGYPKEPLLVSLLVFRLACVLGDLVPYLVIKVIRK